MSRDFGKGKGKLSLGRIKALRKWVKAPGFFLIPAQGLSLAFARMARVPVLRSSATAEGGEAREASLQNFGLGGKRQGR